MESDDLSILKENTVDFISFSYYMSLTESADEGLEKRMEIPSVGSKILTFHLLIGDGKLIRLV